MSQPLDERAGRMCTRCIMDTTRDPSISFNAEGVCSHCQRYDRLLSARVLPPDDRGRALERLVEKIKLAGRGREYDCVIGVSGGADSTYVAYLVKKWGLRPLAVHVDNGWDSELAVKNIEVTLKKCAIDLHTHVLDWEEFRELQVSFLLASTPDGEIPTDHAIFAALWSVANERGIRFILSGMNFATESFSLPSWSYGHSDWRYIRGVHSRFSRGTLRSYPRFSLLRLLYLNVVRRIRTVSVLNYIDYRREEAIALLERELGWRNYGGKHHESIYTRFYQGYVLPKKFGVDKRYGHLSDLVKAGQLTRAEALAEVEHPTYDPELQLQDLDYVCKKLRLTANEFAAIMGASTRTFRSYANSYVAVELLRDTVNYLRRLGGYPR